jgi:hypothetical protein
VRSDPSRKTQALVHVTYQAVGVRLRIRPRAGKITPYRKSRGPLAGWSAEIRLLTRL